jgi:hypothetical protein
MEQDIVAEVERVKTRGYGMDAYLKAVESMIGSHLVEAMNSTLGQTDSVRDNKMTNLLLCKLIEQNSRIEKILATLLIEGKPQVEAPKNEAPDKKK